jgi:hypothetical protein
VTGAGAARASLALAAALGAVELAPAREPRPCRAVSAAAAEPAAAVACGRNGGPLPDAARLVLGLPVDANRAEPRVLEALPGVGPRRAEAWRVERERRPFCGVADLDRVSGIGPRTLRNLGPWLEFGHAPGCSHGLDELREPRSRGR